MGLEDPTYITTVDVDSAWATFYKGPNAHTVFSLFKTNISQILGLDDIEAISLFFELQLDGIKNLKMHDLTIMQLAREFEANPE